MSLLHAVKSRLETPETGAATTTADLRDLLIVTWAVPPGALRPHVPDALALDRLPGEDGDSVAFVQTVVDLRLGARWSPLPGAWGESFRHAEVRALVRADNQRGAFVLQSYVSHATLAGALLPVARHIDEGRFSVFIAGDPITETYERYAVRVRLDRLDLDLAVDAAEAPESTPVGPWKTLTEFVTRRPLVFHPARVPKGGLVLVPTHHAALTPQAGTLTAAHVAALTGRGILSEDALQKPLTVHYQPRTAVSSYPLRWWKPGEKIDG